LLAWVHHLGRRLSALRAADVLRRDPRPPILLLRTFSVDHAEEAPPDFFWDRLAWPIKPLAPIWTFEDRVVGRLMRLGPVLAIGNPSEWAAPVGAGRLWVGHDVWKDRVVELLKQSQLVVMIMGKVGSGTGLSWEVNAVTDLDMLDRLILVLPP